jgi:hypothetical protein
MTPVVITMENGLIQHVMADQEGIEVMPGAAAPFLF